MINLKIDPEFQSQIPPLTDDEFKQLEENILKEGTGPRRRRAGSALPESRGSRQPDGPDRRCPEKVPAPPLRYRKGSCRRQNSYYERNDSFV